jgi:GAF domain-containing protein
MIQPDHSLEFLNELAKALEESSDAPALAMQMIAERFPHYRWVGIYWLIDDALWLGPYVGDATEHIRISIGQGVCGTAVAQEKNLIVPDVRQLDNYLACSLKTRAEIVVLIRRGNQIVGQIDADADETNAFDTSDESMLIAVAEMLGKSEQAMPPQPYQGPHRLPIPAV